LTAEDLQQYASSLLGQRERQLASSSQGLWELVQPKHVEPLTLTSLRLGASSQGLWELVQPKHVEPLTLTSLRLAASSRFGLWLQPLVPSSEPLQSMDVGVVSSS